MKVRLTENQVVKLLGSLQEQTDSFNLEKEAPNLAKIMKMFADMSGNEDDNPDVDNMYNQDITTQTLNNKGVYAPNTPKGSELFHPLGKKSRITSFFGPRNIKVRGATKDHKGVDISTPSGSPVYAPKDGKVVVARDTSPNGCGGFVKLNHGDIQTKFCHLKKWVVRQGQDVKKGQVIGYSGGSKSDPYRGTSSGAHLHYEILSSSGVAMNPLKVQPNLA